MMCMVSLELGVKPFFFHKIGNRFVETGYLP